MPGQREKRSCREISAAVASRIICLLIVSGISFYKCMVGKKLLAKLFIFPVVPESAVRAYLMSLQQNSNLLSAPLTIPQQN